MRNTPSNQDSDTPGPGGHAGPIIAVVIILIIAGIVLFIAGSSSKGESDTVETSGQGIPEIEVDPEIPDLEVPEFEDSGVTDKVAESDQQEMEDPVPVKNDIPVTVWVEGEDAVKSAVSPHPWWYDKMVKDEFSGGSWISNWSDKAGTASYSIDIPESGTYTLWFRLNPHDSLFSFRTENGLWRSVDTKKTIGEVVNTAEAGKVDMRYIGWVNAGTVKLEKGKQSLDIKFHSSNSNHGILDCFLLTTGEFTPDGKHKPVQKTE